MACTRVGVLLPAPVSRRTKRRKKQKKKKHVKREMGKNRFLRRGVLCLRSGWTRGSRCRSIARRNDDLRRRRSRRRSGNNHYRLHELPDASCRSHILSANDRSGFQQSHLKNWRRRTRYLWKRRVKTRRWESYLIQGGIGQNVGNVFCWLSYDGHIGDQR